MRNLKFFSRSKVLIWAAAGAIILVFAILVIIESIAPSDFPIGKTITIKKNLSLNQTADLLYNAHIIKSEFLFKAYSVIAGGKQHVIADDYVFSEPQSALRIAYRTTHDITDMPRVKVTIWEGSNVNDIAKILGKSLPDLDVQKFLALAEPHEGYLFPDTYYFYVNATPEKIVETMMGNFDEKIDGIKNDIYSYGTTTDAIITMASIVEVEATSTKDRQIIAGILWKRLQEKMPLAVDPPFRYSIGKTSTELTVADLTSSSPYNLYNRLGLTPTPIDSPGLDAILATIHPVKTKYYYYLSDKHGVLRYAATYQEHLANKEKYLSL